MAGTWYMRLDDLGVLRREEGSSYQIQVHPHMVKHTKSTHDMTHSNTVWLSWVCTVVWFIIVWLNFHAFHFKTILGILTVLHIFAHFDFLQGDTF